MSLHHPSWKNQIPIHSWRQLFLLQIDNAILLLKFYRKHSCISLFYRRLVFPALKVTPHKKWSFPLKISSFFVQCNPFGIRMFCWSIFRNSRPEEFCGISTLKNFLKLTSNPCYGVPCWYMFWSFNITQKAPIQVFSWRNSDYFSKQIYCRWTVSHCFVNFKT